MDKHIAVMFGTFSMMLTKSRRPMLIHSDALGYRVGDFKYSASGIFNSAHIRLLIM